MTQVSSSHVNAAGAVFTWGAKRAGLGHGQGVTQDVTLPQLVEFFDGMQVALQMSILACLHCK